jgi:hypothetical protein
VLAFIVFLRERQSTEKITKLPDFKYGHFEKKLDDKSNLWIKINGSREGPPDFNLYAF